MPFIHIMKRTSTWVRNSQIIHGLLSCEKIQYNIRKIPRKVVETTAKLLHRMSRAYSVTELQGLVAEYLVSEIEFYFSPH